MKFGKAYNEINIGDTAFIEKKIDENHVNTFAAIIGDLDSFHINEEIAKDMIFETRICHGMLIASFISPVLGRQLPGPGTIYVSQNVRFKAPVRIGDRIHVGVEVIEKMDRERIKLKTIVKNQNNMLVVEGECIVIPPKKNKNLLTTSFTYKNG